MVERRLNPGQAQLIVGRKENPGGGVWNDELRGLVRHRDAIRNIAELARIRRSKLSGLGRAVRAGQRQVFSLAIQIEIRM